MVRRYFNRIREGGCGIDRWGESKKVNPALRLEVKKQDKTITKEEGIQSNQTSHIPVEGVQKLK